MFRAESGADQELETAHRSDRTIPTAIKDGTTRPLIYLVGGDGLEPPTLSV